MKINSPRNSEFAKRPPVHRDGFTLIELLVVITMMGAMLSLVGMTFYLLMRSEKLVSQSFVTERSIARLACQFRDDVHQSESREVVPESSQAAAQLLLKSAGKLRVRYRVTKDGIARQVVEGDVTVSREDFRLPDCRVRFVDPNEAAELRCELDIERSLAMVTRPSQAHLPLRSLRIQAYLNRQRPIVRRADVATANVDRSDEAREEAK
jgi:prepilin-type N-terminal cleavage/methylation domain-containing protein